MKTLTPQQAEAARHGKRVYTIGENSGWFSADHATPINAVWGTALSGKQSERIKSDKLNVGALGIGEGVRVVRSYHPKHGEKYVMVTRLA